jgi:hypothetical protein
MMISIMISIMIYGINSFGSFRKEVGRYAQSRPVRLIVGYAVAHPCRWSRWFGPEIGLTGQTSSKDERFTFFSNVMWLSLVLVVNHSGMLSRFLACTKATSSGLFTLIPICVTTRELSAPPFRGFLKLWPTLSQKDWMRNCALLISIAERIGATQCLYIASEEARKPKKGATYEF